MHSNFRRLAYLVAAADHGSITAAAEAIGISQPAISAAIRHVELDIGYRLFVRKSAKGLALTPSGRQFIRRAKLLLNEARAFEKTSKRLGGVISREIELGCYFLTAPYVVPPIVKVLASHSPAIGVNLHEQDLPGVVADLKKGVTEFALTYDLYQDSEIAFETLFETQPHVILAANDPLTKQRLVSLKQLAARQMVLLNLPMSPQYSEFEHLFAMYGLRPVIRHRLKNFELVRSMVGAGLGYYSFGRLPIQTDTTYDGNVVVRRPLQEDVPKSRLCLAYAQDSVAPHVVRIVKDACKGAFQVNNPHHTCFRSPAS
jgi:DNA-binding transcriptional LysR family regulator